MAFFRIQTYPYLDILCLHGTFEHNNNNNNGYRSNMWFS